MRRKRYTARRYLIQRQEPKHYLGSRGVLRGVDARYCFTHRTWEPEVA